MDLFTQKTEIRKPQGVEKSVNGNNKLIFKISKCITSKNTEFDRLRLRVIDELKNS